MKTNIWIALLIFLMPVFSYAEILDTPVTPQEQDQWCWAGVSDSVLKYYGNKNIKQCQIAEYTRTHATFHNFGTQNCCANPGGACNYWNYNYGEAGSIQDILKDLGTTPITNDGVEKMLTEQEVADNIAQNRPFIIRVCCGGHFIVGRGLENGNLYYMDPWPGEGLGFGPYGSDVNGRTWTHTNVMTVSPSGASPTPTPTAQPTPQPTPKPTPGPQPTPKPTPKPTPGPQPTPKPTPTPTSVPQPTPGPQPFPTPKPFPYPDPSSNWQDFVDWLRKQFGWR
ncbi:MAG: hypothetical protein LUQ11_14795 [Methylococcaceae bacterium]|nr:hypothetical protein [Methylococcaceae bacterium]